LVTFSNAAFTGVAIVLAQCPAPGHVPSPPPVTVAVFTDGDTALTATVTGALITGALPPGSNTAAVVQLTVVAVLALQSHPVPLGVAVVVIPLGNASLTVSVPLVLVVPGLLTTIEYVPVCPTANALGVALLAMANCTVPPFVFVTLAVFAHGAVVHVVPAGGVAVTLFVIDPVAPSVADPVTARLMLAPFVSVTPDNAIAFVVPLVVGPQLAPALGVHVHALTVTLAGTVSVTVAPGAITSLGPVFVTVIV
jgi:hypothetical protein